MSAFFYLCFLNKIIIKAIKTPIVAIPAPTQSAEVNPYPIAIGIPAKNAPEAFPILNAL